MRVGEFEKYVGLLIGTGSEPGRVRFFSPNYSTNEVQLIVTETWAGDATLDGIVDHRDFERLYANFGGSSGLFTRADFNLDGRADFTDFQLLERNFGRNSPVGASPEIIEAMRAAIDQVPEPGALSLLLGAAAITRRRRR